MDSDELTNAEVEQILGIVRDHSFDYVDVQTSSYRVTVARGAHTVDQHAVRAEPVAAAAAPPATPVPARVPEDAVPAAGPPQASSDGASAGSPTSEESLAGYGVRSPIMGVFYRAPSATEPAFVDVGTVVKVGDTLGLVEVMKTFAPVTADVSGTILEVRAQNAARIEPGQVLFVIERG